jgi:hypothetical protein
MKRRLMFYAMFLIIVSMIALGCSGQSTTSGNSTGKGMLYNNSFISESSQLEAHDWEWYNVTTDSPVNLLFMDSAAYQQYVDTVKGNGTGWSALVTMINITGASFNYTVPAGGTYYVIVDNTGKVPGGSDGKTDIRFNTSCVYG